MAAPPGDNGTVKVHRTTTPAGDPRNEPKVCTFYLAGFGFDPAEQVSWYIQSWPPTGDRTTVLKNTLALGSDGNGRTSDLALPDGHYKLFWNFEGEHGAAKHKVFWVKCPKPSPSQGPSTPPSNGPGVPNPGSPTPTKPGGTTPSSPAVPSPSPSPTPSGDGGPQASPSPKNASAQDRTGGLPVTGFAGTVLLALAALLILGGGTAVMLTRRRGGRSPG
jgi:hypothetical protein